MKTIAFFRYAPIYRSCIYQLMNQELDVDFLFCGDSKINIKQMDYSLLQNCDLSAKERGSLESFHYESNIPWKKLFKYKNIITTGNPKDLTVWLILLSNKVFRKRSNVFLWTHGAYGNEGTIKKLLKRIMYGMSSGVLLYGNYAKDILLKNKLIVENKLHVIYNSLNYDEQLSLRKNCKQSDLYRKHFGNDNKNIIIICRVTVAKKIDMLLDAVVLLRDKGFDYNITVIGDGEALNQLVIYAKEKNIYDKVWFYGACYDDAVTAGLLYNSDVCVSPGEVGLTAIHSMMFGTPVITHKDFCTQGPEFESIKPGETGDFFEKNNVSSLAHAIELWFKNDKDRECIRERCYKIVDDYYNPHKQIELLKSVLK